jgi:hypothetical protein
MRDRVESADHGVVRSPCPFMNALANHHIIPHNGKGTTRDLLVEALASAINFDTVVASRFFSAALLSNPNHGQDTLDLDMLSNHGVLEHDASLLRNDFAFGIIIHLIVKHGTQFSMIIGIMTLSM